MKKFMLMHFGSEKPTDEIMNAWGAWFESITGHNIIEAESLDEAERIAKTCPYIESIRVYELR